MRFVSLTCALGAAAVLVLAGCSGSGRVVQESFATPEEAAAALAHLAATGDREYGRALFGPERDELSSGDPDVDSYERQQFAAAIQRRHTLQRNADGTVDILIGEKGEPFPVPLVEHEGRWLFDTPAGLERLTDIRVGHYELRTLQGLRAVALAQQEYKSADHDGDGVLEYAQRFRSTAGQHDGLYWPTSMTEPNSPLGSFLADAESPLSETRGYNGYFYKMLTAHGSAGAGAQSYLDSAGNLVGGFGVLAYPAVYGETGIMTFQMGPDGVIYQSDLGESDTRSAGQTITAFNPVEGWVVTND